MTQRTVRLTGISQIPATSIATDRPVKIQAATIASSQANGRTIRMNGGG